MNKKPTATWMNLKDLTLGKRNQDMKKFMIQFTLS